MPIAWSRKYILPLLLFSCIHFSRQATETVNIGLTVTTSGGAVFVNGGTQTLEGTQFFTYWYRRHYAATNSLTIQGKDINFDLVVKNDSSTLATIEKNYREFVNDSRVLFLMAPFGTSGTTWAANITEAANKMLISSSSSSSTFNQQLRRTFSTWSPLSSRLVSMLPLIRFAGIRTAVIYRAPFSTAGIAGEVCTDLPQQLADQDIATVETMIIDYIRDNSVTPQALSNWTKTAEKIAALNPDVVISCSFANESIFAVSRRWIELNWTPKLAVIATDVLISHNALTEFFLATDFMNENVTFPGDKYFGNWTNYQRLFEELFPGKTATALHISSTYAGILLMEAIKRAGTTTDLDAVVDAFRRTNIATFFGTYTYSSENKLLLGGYSYQVLNGSRVPTGPLAIRRAELISPIPTWLERRAHEGYYAVEIVAFVVISLCILNTIFWWGVVFVYRNHKTIRAGSPLFLAAMLFGSLLIYVGLAQATPTSITSAGCVIKVWFVAVGATLLHGSLIAKSWRLWRLWANESLKSVKVSNKMVAGVLAGLLVPDIALILSWSLASGIQAANVIVDPYRPALNYVNCMTTTSTGPALLWSIFAWHMIYLLAGCGIAWKLRKIPNKIYDESGAMSFSIYNSGFFAVFIAVLLAVASADGRVSFGILVFLACTGCLITTNSIMVTKWRLMRKPPNPVKQVSLSETPTADRMLQFASAPESLSDVLPSTLGISMSRGPNHLSTAAVAGSTLESSMVEAAPSYATLESLYLESQREIKALRKRIRKLERQLTSDATHA